MNNKILKVSENLDNFSIKIEIGKIFVEIYFMNINKKCDIFVNKNITYNFINIWNGVDVKYTKSRKSIKEIITLNNQKSSHVLKFLIKTNYNIKMTGNKLSIDDENNKLFDFKSMRILDSDSREVKDGISTSFDKKNGIFEIRIKHLDEKQYPLTIS